MSHYCKICGCYKSNESFSGSGHRSHICKACRKLPAEKREEILTIARIDFLPFHLSKGNRRWLEKLKTDPGEAVKREATAAWEARFARSLRCPSDEDEENEPWEEYLPEDDGPEPESTAVPSELPDDLDLPF